MIKDIYKDIVYDSPVPYAKIKSIFIEDIKEVIFIDINKGFEDVFNVKKEVVINKSLKEIFKEDCIEYGKESFKQLSENKYEIIRYLKCKEAYFTIEIYKEDVNEYHVRFSRLNNQSYELSAILRKAPYIAWLKDLNGDYIDVNNQYLSISGLKYGDVIGKSYNDIFNFDNYEDITKSDSYVIENNELIKFSHKLDIGDTKDRFFEVAKWPYNIDDRIIGVVGIAIEITDTIKLKKIIEETEKNFLDMANELKEIIIIRDEEKALFVSSYFEEMYGFKPDKLYESIDNWYNYWDKVEFLDEIADYYTKEITINVLRVVKEGKLDKWIECKFAPIFDEYGNIIKKIGIIEDITDKKILEEEIENVKLEFFANLSHELRTPINVILSALQVMKLNKVNMDNRINNKYLKIINQNSLRLVRLVNNLIDTTKINSGHFKYNPQNRDIVSFVENITMSVVDFVERNNLEITFDTDVEEMIIAFDLNHMERIILNLISNAIKFNKENGKIDIIINIEDNVKIIVKDTGIGVPQYKINSIFDRFEQVNKHSRRECEGSGIGLSLVKSLVEMHKGKIELNSSINEGSEFIITLPIVLLESDNNNFEIDNHNLNQISKLEVEFSDIYL